MLTDVLKQLAADTGLHPEQQRADLIEILNKGAKELYQQLECNMINREVTLVVPRNKVVALPQQVGELRGTRVSICEVPFNQYPMSQPRYVTNTLGYQYDNWRDLGNSPFHTTPTIVGTLTVEPLGIEAEPVTVAIVGESNLAAQVSEDLLMDQTRSTTNLFTPNIKSIGCTERSRVFDMLIKDESGIEIARLLNNQRSTRYKLVDVSKLFWGPDTAADETLVDILYKLPFSTLYNSDDGFAGGDDYDEPWYCMCMYMYLKPLENKQAQALQYRADVLDFCKAAKESSESYQLKKLSFGRNKYYDHFGTKFAYDWPVTFPYRG